VQEPLNPLSDQFEELTLQITADLRTIEQRLEWVSRQDIHSQVAQFRETVEEAERARSQAFGTVHQAYRGWPSRQIASVAADPEGTIETLQSFDQEVAEGTAKAEREREELQEAIAKAEQNLAELSTRLAKEEETLQTIDGKTDRDAWRQQQQVVRSVGSQRHSLDRELRKDRQRLTRIGYRPDRGREREVQRIRGQIQSFLNAAVDHDRLSNAREAYQDVLRASEALIAFLEEQS
jgi:chromosome segregation ATPase